LSALAVVAAFNVAAKDEEYRTDLNPAFRYYQVMIRGPEFSEADRSYLMTNEWRGKKLPERFINLVSPLDTYFKQLQIAAKATVPCDWGIDFSPGPYTLLPHLGRCKSLAQFGRLRVMWELQDGREAGARDDLIAMFALGRNSSRDWTLIAVLVQYAIENITLNTVAENFHSFSPETLQRLEAGFDAAPAFGTAAEALRQNAEIRSHNWVKERIQRWRKEYQGEDAKVMSAYREMIRQLGSSGEEPRNPLWDELENAPKSSEEVLKLLGEADQKYYERLTHIMGASHPEFEEQATQFTKDVEHSNNPFVKLSFSAILKCRPKEFRAQAKLAMFHAAVACKLRGEPGLREVSDPFGQGPFQFERFVFEGKDRGFKLTSAYNGNGYPEAQIFVEKDGKPFICEGPKAGQPLAK
jgi:hypothetical protein